MSILIRHLTIDCADPYESALFWSKVTGRPLSDDDHPGDPEALVVLPDGNQPAALLFVRVPEGKSVKNRLHLDLKPAEGSTLVEEVERLVALGATVLDDRRKPDGIGWIVLADPTGNEFCVESSHAEIKAVRG
jgi:predicted enzyme related to lactoylglutathione lyase